MKIMENIIQLISVASMFVVTVAWVSTPPSVCAQSELTTTFTNGTGRNVNDLHIKYYHAISSITQNPKKFEKVSATNLKKLSDENFAANRSIEIIAIWDSGDIDINQWWTINGKTVGDAKEALDTLKAKIKARDAAREKLEEARENLSKALAAIASSGGKETPAQTKQLEDLRAKIAQAEAALEKAEAELLAARVALEKAIAELPDGKEKDALKMERDYLYSVAFPQHQASAQNEQSNVTDMLGGVVTIEIRTDEGPIKLKLPNDMRAGETVSGSLVYERQGATDELSGAVVEINGRRYNIRDKLVTFVVPAMTETLGAALKSKNGTLIAKFNLPHQSSTMISPNNFQLPSLGQQGRNIVVQGPFDGDLSNTTCTVGGQPVKKLAESGRMSVFESPTTIAGLTEIKLSEGNAEAKGAFRNIGIKLTAGKTKLVKGERTQTTVSVNVGQNLSDPIDVQISCTGAVDMQGGNLQNIRVEPSQVSSDGTFTKTFLLTGTQAGGFTLKATAMQPNPTTGKSDCKCKCEFTKTPIVSAGKRNAEGGGTEYSFKPSVNTGCSGNRCEVTSIAYSWSIGAGSTATSALHAGTDKVEKLVVDVKNSGTLILTVTVTVTCSDGSTCTATATKTFDVKK